MQPANMKTLFLAWQAPTREWFPVGRLMADPANDRYQFDYIHGALRAQRDAGFSPMLAFPDFNQQYCASELFPLFKNRILSSGRKDFADYLRSLDLDPDNPDMLEVLAVTGGERQTDSFEVFPKINKDADGSFKSRFFLHGSRHVNPAGQARAQAMVEGEALRVAIEVNNPATQIAILLYTQDYLPLGWSPRYLVADLLNAMSESPQLNASVIKVNSASTPVNRRYLIELTGKLPMDFDPMAGSDYQPIH